ncbi:ankyrin repeat domain-containing protein [Pseudomonas germanica]|uniref:Ankyrin repeat domain-containing protein n=1 Tax=Pseudomonas germanica TaxID=2815720 RepID=A0ABX8YR62_9PSED|nr:ankyrin repeat domain-containing protein [Pseudomonas germanica]QYY82367.1 ankyrin repeat domain-containing protein [Pseudomonas germanica]
MTDSTPPPQLTDNYSKCRTVTVTAAAFILLGLYSPITLPETIPVIGISIKDKNLALLALELIGAYNLLRMVIEWCNSSPARRKTTASRLDFGLAALISVAALTSWGFHYFKLAIPDDFSYAIALGILIYSAAMGSCISTMMFSLNFIRSKKEALRSGLPRIPNGTRGTFLLAALSIIPLPIIKLISQFFSSTMQSSWIFFALIPVTLMVFSEAVAFLSNRVKLSDGSYRDRTEHLQRLQKIFDTHDAQYQVGGWDKKAEAKPSALYSASESGDVELIKKLLSQGASPDEMGQLGWTPVMIAVAQGHETAAHVLLEAGANPNVYNSHGRTPLMFASRYGNMSLVNTLLAAGADPNLKGHPESGGPIMAAAAFGHSHVAARLVDVGADTAVCNRNGHSIVEVAEQAGHGETATLLRKRIRDKSRESS